MGCLVKIFLFQTHFLNYASNMIIAEKWENQLGAKRTKRTNNHLTIVNVWLFSLR